MHLMSSRDSHFSLPTQSGGLAEAIYIIPRPMRVATVSGRVAGSGEGTYKNREFIKLRLHRMETFHTPNTPPTHSPQAVPTTDGGTKGGVGWWGGWLSNK